LKIKTKKYKNSGNKKGTEKDEQNYTIEPSKEDTWLLLVE
jgi:hypothetical protein